MTTSTAAKGSSTRAAHERIPGVAPFTGFRHEAIQFLADLAANNERAWFQPRKAEYERLLKEPLISLVAALDEMVAAGPPPEEDGRPRQFIDRVFTIRGAGTVVTGTLTGGPIAVGDEVDILPSAHRARVRGLQTHKRTLQVARPISRVAVNLAGTAKQELDRGDTLTVDRLRLLTGKKQELVATGAVRLRPLSEPGLDLNATLAHFRLVNSAQLQTAASGKLQLGGFSITVRGTISRPARRLRSSHSA